MQSVLLQREQLATTVKRLAYQVAEGFENDEAIIIIGLQPRGIVISDMLVNELKDLNKKVQYGKLDITFYRDDVRSELHKANSTDLNFTIDNKKIILVDDVLYTGRTIRAALDAINDFGRPSSVKLAVLINRKFDRQLPIQPDFSGLNINTHKDQKVRVDVASQEVILY